ncbi:hypothetical protein CYMTET_23541 [Cymbomonas tetramitiformis]|uniref:Uncharacterized protein n=1 Tax=Cymbomonas tetramitiformis TaxID=36881 RepID=A0AAE0FYE6_9CHLO|nr:hypothetical protein CYMTET_23541 [Cymbomonas tetramitiformis]
MEFDFTVQYRPGPKNENADAPSRYPLPTTVNETGSRRDRDGDREREASYVERFQRGFVGDTICLVLAQEPLPGVEVNQEAQVANYCERLTREQLGFGEVHRLFDLHLQEELECNKSVMFDTDHPEVVRRCSDRLTRVAWDALSRVHPVKGMHSGVPAAYHEETMEHWALKPCGGLCAGLEMLLRCGVKINRYLYQDVSPASQAVGSQDQEPSTHSVAAILICFQLLLSSCMEQLPPNLEDTKLEDLV